MVHIKV